MIRAEETTENQSAEILNIEEEDNKISLQRDVKEWELRKTNLFFLAIYHWPVKDVFPTMKGTVVRFEGEKGGNWARKWKQEKAILKEPEEGFFMEERLDEHEGRIQRLCGVWGVLWGWGQGLGGDTKIQKQVAREIKE